MWSCAWDVVDDVQGEECLVQAVGVGRVAVTPADLGQHVDVLKVQCDGAALRGLLTGRHVRI